MNKTVLFAIFLVLTAWSNQLAQSAAGAETQSAPSLLAPLRPGATWKVKLLPETQRTKFPALQTDNQSAGKQAAPDSKLGDDLSKALEENAVGQDFRKQILFNQGHRVVRYAVGNMVVIEFPGSGELTLEPSNDETYGGPLGSRQLLEFSWINPGCFEGTAVIDGVECNIYISSWPLSKTADASGSLQSSRPVAAQKKSPTILAAISKKDRLPIRLEDPVEIRQYVFGFTKNPPALPAEVAEALQRQEQAIRSEIQRYNLPQ